MRVKVLQYCHDSTEGGECVDINKGFQSTLSGKKSRVILFDVDVELITVAGRCLCGRLSAIYSH